MNKVTRKAIVIALIAGILVVLDGIITKLLGQEASFTWVAFISWTVFFASSLAERKRAILGYVIGFLAAFAIIELGNLLKFMNLNILGVVAIGSLIATVLINYLCIEFERLQKIIPASTSGVFVGISMTFSGLGIGLAPNTFENSLLMLIIIVVYGILGLLSGWATLKFGEKRQ